MDGGRRLRPLGKPDDRAWSDARRRGARHRPQALTEWCVYDAASGQLLTGSFLDYAVPRAQDLPAISVTSRDVASPTNPLGVKGAGEGATVGAPGAVIHAILDTLAPLGVVHIDTPARVWPAIQNAR